MGAARHDFGCPEQHCICAIIIDRFKTDWPAVAAGLKWTGWDGLTESGVTAVTVGTMHAAKGLEFKAVVVMACDEEVIPSEERIEADADEADLMEVYDSERHLLYVACTLARDHLLVSAVAPGSEFLGDMRDRQGRH